MKISTKWEHYKEYTQTVSTICRRLGFAAAAIAWLFKNEDNSFPSKILQSLLFLMGFFLADIIQYLIASILLKIWIRGREKELWDMYEKSDADVEQPTWIDKPSEFLFYTKVGFLLFTYILIAIHVF